MNHKFLKFINIAFLGIFAITIFEIVTFKPAESQSKYFRVKSHPKYDKEFSGKTFVIDGDSIRVGGKEVRLVGIDAPEYSQTCFDDKNRKYFCGKISKNFLIKLAGGKNVKCQYSQKDKYNRFLGKCFIGDISINESLVENGMAVIYSFTETNEKMEKLEKTAKNKKLGIWRGSFELPKDYRRRNFK